MNFPLKLLTMIKIEITAAVNPAHDYSIYAEGQRISTPRTGVFSNQWDESDISYLLSDRQFKKFEAGEYCFQIPTWKIRLLQNRRAAANNTELRFLSHWNS